MAKLLTEFLHLWFSQEKKWYIDQMLKVLSLKKREKKNLESGIAFHPRDPSRVGDFGEKKRLPVWGEGTRRHSSPGWHHLLDILLQVTESDAVDVLEACLTRYSSDIATRSMSLIALLKLSSRFPPTSEYVLHLVYCHFATFTSLSSFMCITSQNICCGIW
ncbi:hypothetical protein BHE74_00016823 [Ensete ventricosum]|nr:hypothetical protein GW17_00008776 [Ensete ventricosum]RWW75165.1 hypothetical protein BHE74_00016823 [Ensete ventricosum]